MSMLLIIYSLLLLLVAWKNFRWAIFLFILFLPTYLIRFELLRIGKYPFPSTLLEITFGWLLLVWFIKYGKEDGKRIFESVRNHKVFFLTVAIFFISSVISIFVSDMVFYSLGEWRAYFLEPILFFLILVGRDAIPTTKEESLSSQLGAVTIQNGQGSLGGVNPTRDDKISGTDLLWALVFSTLSISVFAIVQKFTGWGIATPEWTNVATRRVTAFFSSPNAVGLYLAPTLPIIFVLIIKRWESVKKLDFRWLGLLLTGLFSFLALIFTKSQGAWIGLGAGVLALLFFLGYKKITIGLAIAGIVFALVVPSMREAIMFRDQANKNRLTLWGYSWTFLKQNPKNFIFGTGVRQFFRKVQKPYYNKKVMERLIYPHNIFLNFWTEIGLAGALAISFVIGYAAYLANKIRKFDTMLGAGFLGALTVLVVHGLVDVPYFKNDLAFLFWILIGGILIAYAHLYKSQTSRV